MNDPDTLRPFILAFGRRRLLQELNMKGAKKESSLISSKLPLPSIQLTNNNIRRK
ncbi:hypothetical protein PanWU01x14_059730 [Parasponia andersonii]|uniref:Uncharacterized protein n=1 Tax=Parasponia andersonii TaxID=3476 RepID=A0A2P5DIJ8_PARAD|nr:hypothetical protein PanWU01x14_059730 [Parasponia andersonii]